jgi:HEPN domain-containing protein
MRKRRDLVDGWLRKADSDLANASLCLEHGTALDTACFHAQQAAEKAIKAYLTQAGTEFPFVHNLAHLVMLAAGSEPAFTEVLDAAAALTPFAVELRYDAEFWPDQATAATALAMARDIVQRCRQATAFEARA